MKQTMQCKLLLLSLAVAACFGSVQANPVAPQVVAGQASFQQQGNVFTVTNAPNTIINWQSFSVNANEVTRFLQQGADSKVLNRITGQDPSRILGTLQSNGQVFLINPNGILFGKDARIDVQGLAASSLGLSNEDFLAGRQRFSAQGAAGKVENQGSITTGRGGQVYLVAPNVENSGIISTPGGAVMLAAGHSVQLVDAANPALQVVVSAPADSALNLGQVVAQGGRIGMFGALVNQRGVASADSAVLGENGKVLLRSSSRTMVEGGSRTSARGGEVAILGPQVGVTGNARIDASAASEAPGDGGTVLVGGDVRGANAAVPNAQQVYVGRDAVLAADAGGSGKGGKVVVWAADVARVYGAISARGGAAGGDGGFVETSAHQLETAGLRVDAGAARGQRGQWLLDPYDIVVKAVPAAPVALGDVATFGAGNQNGTSEVATALLDGATASVTLQATHDITFSDPVAIAAAAVGLTAQAGNNINVNAALGTNGGTVSLVANDSASGAASGSGSVNIASGIATGVGAIELKGAGLTLGGGATLSAQEMRLLADKIDVAGGASLSATNSVNIAPRSGGYAITLGGAGPGGNGTLNLSGAALAAVSAQSLYIGSSGTALSVAGPVDLSGSNAGSSTLTLIGSTMDIGASLKAKAILDLQAIGTIGGSGALTAPVLYASGGSIALSGANQVGTLAAAASAGDVSFRNAAALNLGSSENMHGVQASGNVTLEATTISQEFDAPVMASTLTLKTSGMASLGTSYDNHATTLVADNVGGLHYTDSGSVNITSMSLAIGAEANGLLVDAGGTAAVSGAVDARGGAVELIGGNVSLGSVAAVKGKDIHLTARSEGLNASGGSLVAGNFVTLRGNSMVLGGAVQGVASSALPDSGIVTLSNPGGTIQLGGNQPNISTLMLDSTGLSTISARKLVVDNMGGEVGGQSIKVDGVDLSGMTLAEALVLRSAGGIDLANAIKLPASATLIANAAGTVSSGAALQANAVQLNGQALNITGGSIVANGGSGGVSLYSAGDVELGGSSATAAMPTFISSSALGSISAGAVQISSGGAMKVSGQIGNAALNLGLEAKGGSLAVAAPVSGNNVKLEADAMDITGTVSATLAILAPVTSGNSVTVGAACGAGCLSLTQLDKIAAATVGIGNSDADGVGSLTVAGPANLNAATTRLGLLSKGGITQSAGLAVQELGIEAGGNVVLDNASNQVGKLAANLSSGDFTFRNAQSLAITRLQGGSAVVESDYDLNGVNGIGTVTFNITGSLTSNGALISANKLVALVTGSVGTAGAPLLTRVDQLQAESTAVGGDAPIRISNNQTKPGTLTVLKLKTNTGNAGNITLDNYGETVVPAGGEVVSDSGDIAITAHSPLRIDGRVESVSGDIALVAGSTGSSSDDLIIGGTALVRSASGNISLSAGSDISYAAANVQAPGGRIAQSANLNAPPPPTIDQCVANASLPGCSAVLPTLNQCVDNPGAAGCQVVLPTVSDCVANPGATGCQVVLPTISDCVANPGAAGCQVVLPSLNQCIALPSYPGCQVVLPTVNQCAVDPSAAGCQVVLPTVSQCVANPSAAGCQAVLPTLSQCVANPSAAGCQVVLPTISQCVANPGATGCQVVLPTLSQCVANPAATGCQVVLPTISQCVANPSAAGCQVVLPTLSQCVANPAAAGCQAVLPTLNQCVANPSATGCQVVLPTIAQCVANPSAAGCQVVLPTLGQCVADPTAAGCQAVLPTIAQCVANPGATGCQVVLPTLSQCVANPAAAGCQVVLPTISQCVANPNATGCLVVLPTISQCVANPAAAGCQVVLPTLSQCVANPAAAGCQAVLPTISQCVANPAATGCQVVLPTLAQCVLNPAAPGCQAVLPTMAQCVAATTREGCQAVLPTLSQCTANQALPGCEVVLPRPDICVLAPASALCQVLSPPNAAEPVKPVQQATTEVVKTINQATDLASGGKATSGSASGSSGSGGVASLSSTPDLKKDGKEADKSAAQDKSGVKNEPVKKLYCN